MKKSGIAMVSPDPDTIVFAGGLAVLIVVMALILIVSTNAANDKPPEPALYHVMLYHGEEATSWTATSIHTPRENGRVWITTQDGREIGISGSYTIERLGEENIEEGAN